MNGSIGDIIRGAEIGAKTGQDLVKAVFGEKFQTHAGWNDALGVVGKSPESVLKRTASWWSRQDFQALFIAAWIHHPTEKGSYMIQLTPSQANEIEAALAKLVSNKELTTRISSHLSKTGFSAGKGWAFLNGYDELLVQIEKGTASHPYLFLKCEGHQLKGVTSSIQHGISWAKKEITGVGETASPALNQFANDHPDIVEPRAAENYSPEYEAFLEKQLGLTGTMVTVEQAIDALYEKLNSVSTIKSGLPNSVRGDTRALAHAILGAAPNGILYSLRFQRGILGAAKVSYTDEIEAEIKALAERMQATLTSHYEQVYHEIRVTSDELGQSLARFGGGAAQTTTAPTSTAALGGKSSTASTSGGQ